MRKNTKLKVISAAVGLLAMSSANAQWAVIDPANIAQTTIIAAKTTLSSVYNYYNMMASGANGQGIQQTTQAVNLLQKQSVENLQTQDLMQRKALGDAKIGEIAASMMPTIGACVEASKNVAGGPKSAAGSAANSSAGGGPDGRGPRATEVVSTATALSKVLERKTTLLTCNDETAGAAGCPDNVAGASRPAFSGGDVEPRGIKGDIKNVDPANESQPAFNSYTFDDNGWKVAKKYAADMAFYDKPKVAAPAQLKKNPAYAALYSSMQIKLNAAQDSIIESAKLRRQSSTDITASVPGKAWADISNAEYTKVTGLKTKPATRPSLFDLVNFEVKNDYYGNEKADLASTEEVNKRLAMNNFIGWQQYQQQENTNILLAHILVQLTTPTSKNLIDNEHAKTMNMK